MISVTVAAQGKNKRLYGGHLKAYGSGRLSILHLDKAAEPDKPKHVHINIWMRLFNKFCDIVYSILSSCFPFIFNFFYGISEMNDVEVNFGLMKRKKRSNSIIRYSAITKLEDTHLAQILSLLDPISLARSELVCKKWRETIDKHIEEMPKIQRDQIRILFDEGEVVVYPVDEKKCPNRYQMPSLLHLSRKLRHLQCLSLFVRGLIPVESIPVLKALCDLSLSPQQIYLIWCKFAPNSSQYLTDFIHSNRDSLVDLGLEECTPTGLITDVLLEPLIPNLTSLRVWNDGKSGMFAISDLSILSLADTVRLGFEVETLDLASCGVSTSGVCALIEAWLHSSPCDLSLSINYCPNLNPDSLLSALDMKKIYFTNGKIVRRGHCLTLFV